MHIVGARSFCFQGTLSVSDYGIGFVSQNGPMHTDLNEYKEHN